MNIQRVNAIITPFRRTVGQEKILLIKFQSFCISMSPMVVISNIYILQKTAQNKASVIVVVLNVRVTGRISIKPSAVVGLARNDPLHISTRVGH